MQEVRRPNENIYINGQPFEGIGEIEPETVPADMPEYVRIFKPSTIEATVKITPQQAVELTGIKRICHEVALDAAHALGYEVSPEEEEALTWAVIIYFSVVMNNSRLFHLCKHSKKRRTRKKNAVRLLRLMDEKKKALARQERPHGH